MISRSICQKLNINYDVLQDLIDEELQSNEIVRVIQNYTPDQLNDLGIDLHDLPQLIKIKLREISSIQQENENITPETIIQNVTYEQEGNKQFQEQNYRKAAESQSNAINSNPTDHTLQANRAEAQTMMNLNDKVIDDCAKGIELYPKYAICQTRILKAQIVNGQFEKGLSQVEKAKENNLYNLESEDNVIQTMVNEIKEFQRLKESQDTAIDNQNKKSQSIACNYFNSLKDTCTKCDKIWQYLIECMIDSQKSFEVKDKIKMAVEKFPRISSDPKQIQFDAISDYFTGDLNSCKSKLDRLKLMDPSFVHLKSTIEQIDKAEDLKTRGNEAFKKGQTEKAIELYNEALKLDSRNIEYNSKILGNRSACWEKLKLYHQAQDDICESIEINENNAKSQLRRANILFHMEIQHESLQDQNKAKQLDPKIQNIEQKIQDCNNRIKAIKKRDLQDVIGVTKTATDNEIKKAWKTKSLSLHPDRMVGKSRSKKLIADKELRELNEAKEILSDTKKRNQQDMNGFDEHGNVSEEYQGFNFGEGGMGGPGFRNNFGDSSGSR